MGVSIETKQLDNKNRILIVSKGKKIEDRLEDDEKKAEKELQEFEHAIGFSKVLKHIVSSVSVALFS